MASEPSYVGFIGATWGKPEAEQCYPMGQLGGKYPMRHFE